MNRPIIATDDMPADTAFMAGLVKGLMLGRALGQMDLEEADCEVLVVDLRGPEFSLLPPLSSEARH